MSLSQILLIPGIGGQKLLLDLYPSALVAFSLRKLRTAYAGKCIRVRRSSDSEESDFGFVNNVLDTSSLLAFVGAGNGLVTTWYDQTTNARNAVQATAGLQAAIVISGTLQTLNTLPAIKFDGTDDRFATSSVSMSGALLCTLVGQSAGATDKYYFDGLGANNRFAMYSATSNSIYQVFSSSNAGASTTFNSSTKATAGNHVILSVLKNGASSALYENGSAKGTGALTTDGFTGLTIGSRFNGANANADRFQEFVIFPSSVDRAAVESNINDFYGVF